jgi:hypothetical protein
LQVVEIIADLVIVEDFRRDHLIMHEAGAIAQLEFVNAVEA